MSWVGVHYAHALDSVKQSTAQYRSSGTFLGRIYHAHGLRIDYYVELHRTPSGYYASLYLDDERGKLVTVPVIDLERIVNDLHLNDTGWAVDVVANAMAWREAYRLASSWRTVRVVSGKAWSRLVHPDGVYIDLHANHYNIVISHEHAFCVTLWSRIDNVLHEFLIKDDQWSIVAAEFPDQVVIRRS